MKCSKCGAELQEGALFCRECGTKVEVQKKKNFCRECGSELTKGVKFCSNCGANVTAVDDVLVDEPKEENGKPSVEEKTVESKVEENVADDNIEEQSNGKIDLSQYQNMAGKNKSLGEKIKKKAFEKWAALDLFCKVVIVALVVVAILLLVSVCAHKGLAIFFSIVQIVGILVSLLMHKDIIKVPKKWLKYIILVIAIALSVLNVMSYSWGSKKSAGSTSEEEKIVSVYAPINADDAIGQDYLEIDSKFSDAGFTNVYLEKIEDLTLAEEDKLGTIESIAINSESSFKEKDEFASNSEVVIKYHGYAECAVNVHVNFVGNWFFDKYDVEFKVDNGNEGTLTHGDDADFELSLEPGEHTISFISADSDDVKGEAILNVKGDTNVSYKIYCHSSEISVEEEYVENLSDVGESDVMMDVDASDYKFKNYKDVQAALETLGFTKFKTEILYDIVIGITDEGEVESVAIGGKSDFKRGDIFKNSDEVVITYHMKEEDDPNKKEETPKEEETTKPNDSSNEEPTNDTSSAVFYSTNDYDTAIKGNTGVFSYKLSGGSYDQYYIIDFDEGYVYYFIDGNGDETCDRLKIESGDLNDKVTVTYHDGSDTWSNYLHFKYVNHPETLIMVDHNGFDYKFSTTTLSSALSLKNSKRAVDY